MVFNKVPNMIHFRVNVWSKSMLSVTSSKKSCMIEVMFSIIEFISFFIQFTKGSNTLVKKVSKAFDDVPI